VSLTVRVAGEADKDRFNKHVAGSPLADVLQSWEWGEIKRETGWKPIRLLLERDDTVQGSCSMLLTRPARGVPPLAYAPRGPVLNYEPDEQLQAMIDGIRSESRGAFMFMCDPAIEDRALEARVAERLMNRVAASGFGGVQPKTVMVLDLEPDLEKIQAGFKSKWRYNIRLAERKGVEVREGTKDDIPKFHDILLETARRDGFSVRGPRYFDSLWNNLAPNGKLKLFIADFGGEPIAGIMLFCMGPRAVYVYGASSNQHRNVMPNHLIQWQAIKWAKENGHSIYDFRGVSPVRNGEPVDQSLAGLNRFKEGFGARYVEFAGQFDLPLRGAWYALWRVASPIALRFSNRFSRSAD
jgi:peptidoglycan pentaglycine glycine transferase (the first glycine)